MTCSVPIFGTDRNIPAVPAGTERNLKPCLQGQDLANAITEDGTSNAKDKANALIFIRRHLHESL